MIEIDTHKFRDPAYQARLAVLKEKLAAVQTEGSFIAYASNRPLLDELSQLIQENALRYRRDYLANLQAYQALKEEFSKQKAALHPIQHQALSAQFKAIEEKLTDLSYEENALAEGLIQQVTKNVEEAISNLEQFSQQIKAHQERLSQLEIQVWTETFEQCKKSLKALNRKYQIPDLQSINWPEEAIQASIIDRKQAFEQLKGKLKGHRSLRKRVIAAENKPISKVEFKHMQDRILRSIKRGTVKGYVLILISMLLVAAGAFYAPSIMRHFDEEKVWEQSLQTDDWQSYQSYLDAYPAGKHRAQARERQLLLDYGKIENIITNDGLVYTYEGELDAGKPDGQGIATFLKGGSYEGAWRGGVFWGQGKRTYADESSYIGEWENGLFHGNGTSSAPNGRTYTGAWLAGKKEGQGSMRFADGNKYLGSWKAGQPHGHGTFTAEKSAEVFGRIWKAGENYSGYWEAGKAHGVGTMRYVDGLMYQGDWQAGMRHGNGKLSWKDNSQFSGIWQGDSINGKGFFLDRFRTQTQGKWKGKPANIKLFDSYGLLPTEGKFENGLFIKK